MKSFDFDNMLPKIDLSNVPVVTPVIDNHLDETMAAIDAMNREKAKHEAIKVAGAEASIAQKEILEQQLDELKTQNEILAEQLKAEQTQREILEEHLKLTTEQNGLLSANYNKLEEMYNAQKESYADARQDLKKSRTFNAWMMVIAIVAMLAAIAGPIVTVLVSR